MNKLELGKRYLIKAGTPVFSVDLQKGVCFRDDVVVEAKQTHLNKVYFGMLIDASAFGSDYMTTNEIEFGPDSVYCEYIKNI